MKNIHLNQVSWRSAVFAIERLKTRLPYTLLIQRFTAVRLGLLLGLFGSALAVVMMLLYITGDSEIVDSPPPLVVLNTEAIDELEVWLEERQAERERSVITGPRPYFKP